MPRTRSVEFYIKQLSNTFGSEPLNWDSSEVVEFTTSALQLLKLLNELQAEQMNLGDDVSGVEDLFAKEKEDLILLITFLNIRLLILFSSYLPRRSSKEDRDDFIQEMIIELYTVLLSYDSQYSFSSVINYIMLNLRNYTVSENYGISRHPAHHYKKFSVRFQRAKDVLYTLQSHGFFDGSSGSELLNEVYYLTHEMSDADFKKHSIDELEKIALEALALKTPQTGDQRTKAMNSERLNRDRIDFQNTFYYLLLDKGNEYDYHLGFSDPFEVLFADDSTNPDYLLFDVNILEIRRYITVHVLPSLYATLKNTRDKDKYALAVEIFWERLGYDENFDRLDESLTTFPAIGAGHGVDQKEARRLYMRVFNRCKSNTHFRNLSMLAFGFIVS